MTAQSTKPLISRLLGHEAAGGVILMMAALLALLVANSDLAPAYTSFLDTKLSILINGEGVSKPLILWINDGLMAIFFFMVGLELKRELLEGKLKDPRDVLLPGLAAAGGMAVPAAIFLLFNATDPATRGGWAIPAATDIAFAVGVLALLGRRIHPSLKIFLLTLAILDDIGAILVIAFFYTSELHLEYLAMALVPLLALAYLNQRGTHRIAPFVLFGTILWVLVLKSGVHATIAGVVTAFFLPLTDRFGKSPLHLVEDGITPYVNFLILPLFAFANAGVVLHGMSWGELFGPLPLGIAAGLFVGKQIGVFGSTWLAVRAGLGSLKQGTTWPQIYGLSCLAGIGFTMSLFIGGLSFSDAVHMNDVRLGVLLGSFLSAVTGYVVLMRVSPLPERT